MMFTKTSVYVTCIGQRVMFGMLDMKGKNVFVLN